MDNSQWFLFPKNYIPDLFTKELIYAYEVRSLINNHVEPRT